MPHDLCFIVEIYKATSLLQFTYLGLGCAYIHIIQQKHLEYWLSFRNLQILPSLFTARIGRFFFAAFV